MPTSRSSLEAEKAIMKMRMFTRDAQIGRDIESLLKLKQEYKKPQQLPLFVNQRLTPLVATMNSPKRSCPHCNSPAPSEYVAEFDEYFCTNCGAKRREGEKSPQEARTRTSPM